MCADVEENKRQSLYLGQLLLPHLKQISDYQEVELEMEAKAKCISFIDLAFGFFFINLVYP